MSISIDDRLIEVTSDIFGLRLPMPPPLEWVNAWFLRDADGWFVVDTGYNTPESRAVLEQAISEKLDGLPVKGVIATHYHPDHVGQAGWLCEKFHCPLYMSPKEWLLARLLSTDHSYTYQRVVNDYYRNAGTPDEYLQIFADRGNSFLRNADEVPANYKRLELGDSIRIGNRTWEILIGRGHSPEMLLLVDREGKFLISGDQVVSRITPNISIWPFDLDDDPLKDFLEVSAELPEIVPNDIMVLPGHGRPFDNYYERIGSYIPFHENRLNKLRAGMNQEPQSLHALLKLLFVRELSARDYVFAIGETHSHLNYLIGLGEVERLKGNALLFRKLTA